MAALMAADGVGKEIFVRDWNVTNNRGLGSVSWVSVSAWVQGSGWKWGEEAAGDDRTAANGLGARGWLEMGGEKSRWG